MKKYLVLALLLLAVALAPAVARQIADEPAPAAESAATPSDPAEPAATPSDEPAATPTDEPAATPSDPSATPAEGATLADPSPASEPLDGSTAGVEEPTEPEAGPAAEPAVVPANPKKVSPNRGNPITWYYRAKLKRRGLNPDDLHVHSIPQSHIDAAWRWRLSQSHRKVYRTWSQALKYMDERPDYTFSGSAPQYYEWIMQDHPEIFAQIIQREKEGRWEIVGGSWIEPDGNIPDGESFCRQRLEGQRFYLKHFGHIADIEWMLDSFGYHRNLPQIVARSGAKYMWTSKLVWNRETVFPFHNFMWRSPDGSQVLTHICPISPMPAFFPTAELDKYKSTRYLLKPGVTLVANYATDPKDIEDALSSDWSREVGVFYGLGDGGLGPRGMEITIQEALQDKGYAIPSKGIDLFRDLERDKDRYPIWDDEMFLEYHHGVSTSQAWIKRANRMTEQMFLSAESLRSVLHVQGVHYPFAQLKEMWKLFLLQHFHDILPGSSIPEVYDDARKDFAKIQGAVREITNAGLLELAKLVTVKGPKKANGLVVYNALAWPRAGLVTVAADKGKWYKVTDREGNVLPSELSVRDGKGLLTFRTGVVPSMGFDTYFVATTEGSTAAAAPSGVSIEDKGGTIVLANQFVRVVIDKKTGLMKSLRDVETGREFLSRASNRLLAWYDRPKEYSAWNIDPGYRDHPIPIPEEAEVKVTRDGGFSVEVLATRTMKRQGYTTKFEQRVRLLDNDPIVYIDVDSDFHLLDSLVKLEFNTNLVSDKIALDGPYLVMERPTHPKTPGEKARWEMVCQKFIDLSEAEVGLTLLNRGKYGFSLTDDGKGFRQTILKGARYPRANPGAYDVKHHYQSFPLVTGFLDQGPQHMELGLLIHKGGWREAKLWEAGSNFNNPLEAVWSPSHKGVLGASGSMISVDSDHIYLGAIKKAEDDKDIVIRLVEATGQAGPATVNFGRWKVKSAVETDLLELNPQELSASGNSLTVDMQPWQIRTFKVKVVK